MGFKTLDITAIDDACMYVCMYVCISLTVPYRYKRIHTFERIIKINGEEY